ncbi:hypothetical protein [Pantoea ananatis]|uniref:hypothetical protein n=1 Tax=Pantoea ananas TaxID=553 RepID=UPI000AAD367E|nr:hypothetical protein [Pantoea ananatis]MDS7721229.1 hypothetical protein [Pantoea ananatis]
MTITVRVKPADILSTFRTDKALTGGKNQAIALVMPETADIDFEPERPVITGREAGF